MILFLLSLVLAQGGTSTVLDSYVFTVDTIPQQLAPGPADLVLHVTKDGVPLEFTPISVRLTNGNKVYLAGEFTTDKQGSVTLSYRFGGPGLYELTAEVEDTKVTMPLHVHGEYILLFGFLAAIFVVFALLVERL